MLAIDTANFDFEFVNKKDPSVCRVFDGKDKEKYNQLCRIRDIDDEAVLFSPLAREDCFGHFVLKLRLSNAHKNRFRVAMRFANIEPEDLMKSCAEHLMQAECDCCRYDMLNKEKKEYHVWNTPAQDAYVVEEEAVK